MGVRREVLELFSTRRRAVTAKTTDLVRAFSEWFGREPSNLERTRLAQQATLITRAGKAHKGETVEQRLDRWEAETRTLVTGGLAQVAHDVLDLDQQSGPAEQWSVDDVVERALAAVAERRQSWSRSDLTRAISDALPGHLHLDPTRVRELLDGLADTAIERAVRLNVEEETAGLPPELVGADGRSAYAKPGAARYTTHGRSPPNANSARPRSSAAPPPSPSTRHERWCPGSPSPGASSAPTRPRPWSGCCRRGPGSRCSPLRPAPGRASPSPR